VREIAQPCGSVVAIAVSVDDDLFVACGTGVDVFVELVCAQCVFR